jgi:hypothetical protein
MKTLSFFKKSMFAVVALGLVFTATSCDDDDDDMTDDAKKSMTYAYEFNNGQVASGTAYEGMHRDDLMAELTVTEKTSTTAEITITIQNTVDGQTYMVHAHDAADPSTTPNGTPYNETPNGMVLATMITGNGGEASTTFEAQMSYSAIVNDYSGFFVIHDPMQAINTADISTYLVVGSFARTQTATNLEAKTYAYAFNTGQLVAAFAYAGSHSSDLAATLKVQELASGNARVSVMLENTIDGEMYMVHAHDAADPATTPNGTPYNETPNADVLALRAMGNGGDVMMSNNINASSETYAELTSSYDGFFVVHDPLQAINTADPTTYVILGLFAK